MGSVTLKGVWKRYGHVEAVKDLNLECGDGEFLALLGPSGCGKSSTLRMIAGLEKATQGRIEINGHRVNDLEPRDRKVAMAFEAYALYPHLTAYENIAFPLRIGRAKPQEVDRLVRQIAADLGIQDVLDRLPRHMSGGQQQRVSFARAMVRPAEVYLMDEPLSHLDARQRSQLRSELKRLHILKQLSIVFVTHDQIEAMAMADRIAVMNFGELQQVATPYDLFNKPKNLFVGDFVGEPPMNLLEVRVDVVDGALVLAGAGFAIRTSKPRLVEAGSVISGTQAILGIRPVHLGVRTEGPDEGSISGEVSVRENLGDSVIIGVRVGEETIRLEASSETRMTTGSTIHMDLPPDRMHLFKMDTGENLLC